MQGKKFKLITIIIGLGIIVLIIFAYKASKSYKPQEKLNNEDLSLINPAIVAGIGKYYIINFQPLKESFVKTQNKYRNKTYIYFAYLNNSSWIGLNEKDLFFAASLTKVPLAMATLKAVEEGKLKKEDKYSLEEIDIDKNFGDLYKKGEGATFSVDELLKIMLEKSDNTAATALFHIFNKIGIANPLDDVYASMGWSFGEVGSASDYKNINLKTLSNMFISLYNATYISPQNSEYILERLANTPFDQKIVAGVSGEVEVSHKVGITDQYKTYSDCGIIYVPNRNYLLCLGAEGISEEAANKFMTEISKEAYEYVINN